MRPQGLQLELDDVADVDDDVGLSEGDEEEGLGFVRLEMLALPELRKHLARRCVGVDGPEDDLRSGDVVGMVHVPTAVAHRRVHGEDHVGTVDPDLASDGTANVDRRLEVAVFEVEEDDLLHPEDPRRVALLGETDLAEAGASHVRILRARSAVGDHAVHKLDARFRPGRGRACERELGVVGVRVDRHRALDVETTVEPHALSLSQCEAKGSGLPGGAFTLPFERIAVAEIVTTWAMRASRHLSCGDGPGRRCTMAEKEGLDDEELEQEVGVPLPERDAMSLIDPSVAKAALSDFATGTVPAQGDAANAAATPTPDKVGGGNVESS